MFSQSMFIAVCVIGLCRGVVVTRRNLNAKTTDLTIQVGATGEDVVDACILKLKMLQTANDYSFVKRIALVESGFGINMTDPNGGIWQVTTRIQEAILAGSAQLNNYISHAGQLFGEEIANMSDPNFEIPLRSALAARLYIELVAGVHVPGSIPEQAAWWSQHYNPGGSEDDFVQNVNDFETDPPCTIHKMDLWFLLDGSGSVSSNDYLISLQFIDELSRKFNISLDEVRTGFSTYDSRHFFVSLFNEHVSNAEFSSVVLGTSKPGGGTATGSAINYVVQQGFTEVNGARPLEEAVPRVLIVMTDGKSGDNVLVPSDNARAAGITVYGVGIGGYNLNEINEIAGKKENAFLLDDFDELITVLQQGLTEGTCDISPVVQDNQTVEAIVEPGDTHYSTVSLPETGSIELVYNITSSDGEGIVYISSEYVNPSSALNQISVYVTVGVTIIIVNSDNSSVGIQLAGVIHRAKRSSDLKQIYVGLQSTGSAPLQVEFTATGSNETAEVMTTPEVTTQPDVTSPQPEVTSQSESTAPPETTTSPDPGNPPATTTSGGVRALPFDLSLLFSTILAYLCNRFLLQA